MGVTELDATASQSQLRGWGRPRGQRLFLHRRLQMLKPSWQHLLILLCRPFLFSFPCFLPEPGIRDIPPTSPIPCLCLSQPTHNRDNRGGTEEQTPMQDLRAWHQVCTILRAFLAHAGGRGTTVGRKPGLALPVHLSAGGPSCKQHFVNRGHGRQSCPLQTAGKEAR